MTDSSLQVNPEIQAATETSIEGLSLKLQSTKPHKKIYGVHIYEVGFYNMPVVTSIDIAEKLGVQHSKFKLRLEKFVREYTSTRDFSELIPMKQHLNLYKDSFTHTNNVKAQYLTFSIVLLIEYANQVGLTPQFAYHKDLKRIADKFSSAFAAYLDMQLMESKIKEQLVTKELEAVRERVKELEVKAALPSPKEEKPKYVLAATQTEEEGVVVKRVSAEGLSESDRYLMSRSSFACVRYLQEQYNMDREAALLGMYGYTHADLLGGSELYSDPLKDEIVEKLREIRNKPVQIPIIECTANPQIHCENSSCDIPSHLL
jgi:phage regulator Rha-like protein